MSIVSITLDVYQTHKQEKTVRDMVQSTDVVTCVRDGQTLQLASEAVVPGDVVHIPSHGCTLMCDAVLITGTCIVNESMLTGESVPVTKTPLPHGHDEMTFDAAGTGTKAPPPTYSKKEHAKHTLFCGTHVLQTRYYADKPVKAVVIRTGYATMKGQLVRSIMYPKPVDFRFTVDLMRFLLLLACIALCGLIYSAIVLSMQGSGARKIILRSLDVITIVVPPALPAAMTIGIICAQFRLKRRKIFCISPSSINTCGAVNLTVFDKTGTLTEDGLDFYSCTPVTLNPEGLAAGKPGSAQFAVEHHSLDLTGIPQEGALVKALACCHSLTRIDGELRGDPMDLTLFEKTGWSLTEPSAEAEDTQFDSLMPTVVKAPEPMAQLELGIIRQLTFSSSLQRMSVIVRQLDDTQMRLYTKGSPEMVASLCRPASVPDQMHTVVNDLARRGFRLIAVAQRSLGQLTLVKAQRASRKELESDLDFVGLVALENRLKPVTTAIIRELQEANIRCVMATGDNLLTGISVARECHILLPDKPLYLIESDPETTELRCRFVTSTNQLQNVSDIPEKQPSENKKTAGQVSLEMNSGCQLAITGEAFGRLVTSASAAWLERLTCLTSVFARMSPEHKQMLVELAQAADYTVAMCGDGANDCGALKSAHAGISLSEAEASIASPFTSQTPDISCVTTVIGEGRAALVTSFGVFKYMAGYSMTQFISVCLLYWIATNLSDFQFLYIDMFLITTMAVLFGYQDAAARLHTGSPPVRILSPQSAISIIGHLIIIAAFQAYMFNTIKHQPWFQPFTDPGEDDNYFAYQGTAVFLLSNYQYLALAVVYSKGRPHRAHLLNNWALVGYCTAFVILTIVSVYINLYPFEGLAYWLNLQLPPVFDYRVYILLLGWLCFALCYLWERWVIDYALAGWTDKPLISLFRRSDKDVPTYQLVLKHYREEPSGSEWLLRGLREANLAEAQLAAAQTLKERPAEAAADPFSRHASETTQIDRQSNGSIGQHWRLSQRRDSVSSYIRRQQQRRSDSSRSSRQSNSPRSNGHTVTVNMANPAYHTGDEPDMQDIRF